MLVLLDTSTPTCRLTLVESGLTYDSRWEAGRELAKGLLGYIKQQLETRHKTWDDISAIGVFQGPGSFTGLRIGMSVLNTIARDKKIPIVAETGDDWRVKVIQRLEAGENDTIALPFYGAEANITKPRK